MGTIQMMRANGEPFFANLHGDSTVTITIGEAYTLVGALQQQHEWVLEMLAGGTVTDTVLLDTFRKQAKELEQRVEAIEKVIDHDKYEQWAAVEPAWAVRAGAR